MMYWYRSVNFWFFGRMNAMSFGSECGQYRLFDVNTDFTVMFAHNSICRIW